MTSAYSVLIVLMTSAYSVLIVLMTSAYSAYLYCGGNSVLSTLVPGEYPAATLGKPKKTLIDSYLRAKYSCLRNGIKVELVS